MIRKNSFLIIILFIFSAYSFAQQQQAYKTQVIDGVEYYIYSVKPSEGLYRISVNFGVPPDEITRINPEVKDGLKPGQILFIPKVKEVSTAQAVDPLQPSSPPVESKTQQVPVDIIAAAFGGTNATAAVSKGNAAASQNITMPDGEPHFYYHKVEKQQTLYSLSRQYEVKQEDIIKYNPGAATGIREGEVLRIPKPEDIYPVKRAEKLQEDISVKYMIHVVEPKETLYAVSKKYNVEIDDILKLNPGMEVLTIGQELKIPYYTALVTTEVKDGETVSFIDWDKIFGGKEDTVEIITPLRIAFLLPFSLENKNDAGLVRFVDFYAGALKAIYEAKKKNISIDVYTYDTGKTKEKMSDIFRKHAELKEMDLIVGPAYSEQVSEATQFARQNRVKTLIPFTSKVPDIETNPYIFQFNPGNDVEMEFMKSMLETRLNAMHYIFADIEGVPGSDEGLITSLNIRKMLNNNGKKYDVIPLSDPNTNLFDSVVIQSKKNLIIFNTDRFQSVQPYFESLNITDRGSDVVLLEKYSWKNQDTYRPAGVYISAFRTESEMPGLSRYNEEFASLLGWEAISRNPRYDILGYDLTRYFISLLSDKNINILAETELDRYSKGIQSQFRFKRTSARAGFVNQQLYLGESQVK